MSINAPDPLNKSRHGGPEYRTAQLLEEAKLLAFVQEVEADSTLSETTIFFGGVHYTPREAFEAYKRGTEQGIQVGKRLMLLISIDAEETAPEVQVDSTHEQIQEVTDQ